MINSRIETFLTLYQQMNYRKTAEILNMTQPGVTQHIQYLEKHYNVKLFQYEGRVLHRTREAEILKHHLDRILADELAMREEFANSPDLRLYVGATKTIGEYVLTPTVSRYLKDPKNRLDLIVDNTQTLLQMLEEQKLDFAVVEGVIDKSRYDYRLYRREKFVGICGVNHPFAGKQIPLERLFQETLLVREPGSGTRKILEQAITDRGYSLSQFARTVSISNFSVIMDLVAKNHFITFAYQPVTQGRTDLASFQVESMPLEGEFNFVYCNRAIAEAKISQFFGK